MPDAEVITIFGNSGRGPVIGEATVDLLVQVEKTFDIRFTEDDVIPGTVGKLCEFVISRLPGERSSKCMSSVTFYALRRAIMQVTGCRREAITPSTRLDSVLSSGGQRRKEWKTIEKYLAFQIPGLTFSNVIEACLSILFFAAAMGVVIWFLPRQFLSPLGLPVHIEKWMGAIGSTGVLALILWGITRAILRPLATQFPDNCESAGDLVRLTVAKNYGRIAKRAGGWNDKEVWNVLRDLIADATSLDPGKITPETSFPDGLNIF